MSSKPKRPNSAYICFTIAKRQEVVAANPGLSNTQLMTLFGKLWAEEKNRAPYEEQAAANKARYAEEIKNYVAPPPEEPSKQKKHKDKNAPKRPKSAYIFFCDVERPVIIKKNPQLKTQEVMQALGPAWQKLSAKGKQKYEKLAAKDKQRYEEEMKTYEPPKRDASPVRAEKPKVKRSKNAFLFYSEAERAKVKAAFPDYKITEISTELGKRWKALSAAERAPFEQQAQAAKAQAQ